MKSVCDVFMIFNRPKSSRTGEGHNYLGINVDFILCLELCVVDVGVTVLI